MAFTTGRPGVQMPQAEINMIPLIDVMLVLLVIFMVTAPLMTHAIRLDLPRASTRPVSQGEKVELAICSNGSLLWNGQPHSHAQLLARLAEQGQLAPDIPLQLHADSATRYGLLAEIMAAASRAGIRQIGFVTRPAP